MIRSLFLIICALVTSGLGFGSAQPRQSWHPYADVIFTHGQIVTVADGFPLEEALAIKDGKVISVGSNKAVLVHRGPPTKVVDLSGKTIIPGIQDSHNHAMTLGHTLKYSADLDFAKDAEDILRSVAELKDRRSLAAGEWLNAFRWDQYKYPKMVTRWQLDSVAPENPVCLYRVYRGVAVNTEVFRLMGIKDDDPDTWPEWWLKDPSEFTFEDKIFRELRTITVNGAKQELEIPTGVFVGMNGVALVTVWSRAQTFDEHVESVRVGSLELLRFGVTAIVDPSSGMGYVMRVYQEAYNRGWLPIRVAAVYEGIFHAVPPEEIRKHFAALKLNRLGDRFLKWQGAKYYADGGAGSRSSWLSESFARWEEYEGKPNLGLPVVADDTVREAQFRAALDYGWDLNTHCTGDRSMRQTMDLYMKFMDEIRTTKPDADLRWSLIHAYLPIEPSTMVLPDMAKYGIVASVNPNFIWELGQSFETNLGPERMKRVLPFRSYVEGGVRIASGSDYYVAHHNPWLGFYAMLTRREQITGKVLGKDETVGIEDALRSYTINGSYLTYDDDIRGTLEVGKLADLVVLDIPSIRDLEANPELCFEMEKKILLTLVEGKVGYQKDGFSY